MIEIYGIPEEVWRCPGCKAVRDLLDKLQLPYEFYNVINEFDGQPVYDRPLIESLAKRIGCYPSLAIRYPVIFMDNVKQYDIPTFKTNLIAAGHDPDIIED